MLGRWDRVLIFGALPGICYAEGKTRHLYRKQIRISHYLTFAEPCRDRLRGNAQRLVRIMRRKKLMS